MGWFSSSPKTYEMPPNAACSAQVLKKSADSGLESYFKFVDIAVTSDDKLYILHHISNGLLGWNIEFVHPEGQDIDDVAGALVSLMGGNKRTNPTGYGQAKTFVSPIPIVRRVRELTDFIDKYETKNLKKVVISGYRLEHVPKNMYNKAQRLSLPLQEVEPKAES